MAIKEKFTILVDFSTIDKSTNFTYIPYGQKSPGTVGAIPGLRLNISIKDYGFLKIANNGAI